MNALQKSLRVVIAGGSLAGFIGGWMLLAHSGKPAQAAEPAPIVAPAPSFVNPSPSIGGLNAPGLQPIAPLPSSPSFSMGPRLRTRGS